MMKDSDSFEYDDLQGLFRFGYGKLTESCFMLLQIVDVEITRQWLAGVDINSAVTAFPPPETALQIAFSVQGLRTLGVGESVIAGFSDEFIVGMAGDESRSRRLGDIDNNRPDKWDWGGGDAPVPHLLLLLYAREGAMDEWRNSVQTEQFTRAFRLLKQLPTLDIGSNEPFGFPDGISQPDIDWAFEQRTGLHERDAYSNRLAIGEVVLGYANEYGLYTDRPLIDPEHDALAALLPDADDHPGKKDLGRNGAYLVVRQLEQDVAGFWQFLDKATDSVPDEREKLAAAMVGRNRNGAPLMAPTTPGSSEKHPANQFTYLQDPDGHQCPLGAHIRRSNPRTGDFPSEVTGVFSRLKKALGFGQTRPDEDLVASTRFHRLLRRGRSYGPRLTPEQALNPDAPVAERGLQFICLVANISRQFEFVQNAWTMSSKFAGTQNESDPLLGQRQPLMSGEPRDQFHRQDPRGPAQKTSHLPQFISVRGGGYFFIPGLRALRYIASASVRS